MDVRAVFAAVAAPPPAAMKAEPAAAILAAGRSAGRRSLSWVPLTLVLVAFACLTTLLNVSNPIWEAIDEPGHFQYVKFVAEQRRLPTSDDHLPALFESDCTRYCIAQGDVKRELPLYYLLEAPFVMRIDLNSNVSWIANPHFTWADYPDRNGAAQHITGEAWPYRGMVLGVHVMRAVSGMMVLGALVALYFTATAIGWGRRFALLATAGAALTPGLLLTSASVNNDNAAILTCSVALLGLVRALTTPARQWAWFAVGVLGTALGLASKATSYFLLPVLGVVGLVLLYRSLARVGVKLARATSALLALGMAGGLVAALFTVPWLASAVPTLKAVPSLFVSVPPDWPCHCTMFAQPLWGGIPNMWETWWGSYGWETFHPPPPFYRPFLAFSLLAAAGILSLVWRNLRLGLRKSLSNASNAVLLLLGGAFLLLLLIVDFRVIATHSSGGTTHARFLFPGVLAGATLIAAGLYVLPKALRVTGFALYFGSCLALASYSAFILPRSFGPELPVYGDMGAAGVQHQFTIDFTSGMRLVGWTIEPDASPTAGVVHLRLFWESWTTPDFDYSAYVHLVGPAGSVISGPDHGPGLQIGLLPHLWQVGEIIPDDWMIQVPASAPPGDYHLVVGVYDYRDLKPVFSTSGQESVTVGELSLPS